MIDWQPITLSLEVSAAALLLTFVAGTVVARLLATRAFPGRSVIEAVIMLPLVLPPVVTGYVLLVVIGRNGVVGAWLEHSFDVRLIFTPYAAVLASAAVAFPLMYQSARSAFMGVDPHLHEAAHSLGASAARVFFTVTIPLSWPGLTAGAVLAFARALGEFGATLMVAGNIPGQTTTVPTAIYSAAESGDLHLAGVYALIIGGFNLCFMIALGMWRQQPWVQR